MEDRAERILWFKRVILPHEAMLRRQLRRMMSLDDADDMTSEVLVRAYATSGWSRFESGGSYIFSIARNLIRDKARRQKVVTFETYADLDVLQVADGGGSPETIAVARDELRVLRAAIDELPPRCRQVFLLRRIDELSIMEVGDRLGLSVKTVERHMTRALAQLARSLAQSETFIAEAPEATWRTGKRIL